MRITQWRRNGSISSLTVTDPEKARMMVIRLSDFMRYGLSGKNEQTVPFASELQNLRLYLEIEKVRFGDRLVTEERIDEKCMSVKIPVLLLQPLYENAIKYGVFGSTGPVRIISSAVLSDEYMQITISNNYETQMLPPGKGTGTGLMNVSRRLELYYGKRAEMKITSENGLYTVRLFIPVSDPQK
jgi:LytS/YehU family sensor histidine kinase